MAIFQWNYLKRALQLTEGTHCLHVTEIGKAFDVSTFPQFIHCYYYLYIYLSLFFFLFFLLFVFEEPQQILLMEGSQINKGPE